jgi:hypothetical protein
VNSGYDRRTAQNEFGIYRLDLAEFFADCREAYPRPHAELSSIPDPFPFALRSISSRERATRMVDPVGTMLHQPSPGSGRLIPWPDQALRRIDCGKGK